MNQSSIFIKNFDTVVLSKTSYSTIEQRVIDLISWNTKIPAASIHPYSDLADDLLMDEFDKLILIAELESQFEIYLTPEQVEKIRTVQDASSYFVTRFAA